jgi:excisionase family DNA binding protein
MTFQEMPELLTIAEAAHLINVHPNTLRNWEKEGRLSPVRIGSRRDRRFTKASIWGIFDSSTQIITKTANE